MRLSEQQRSIIRSSVAENFGADMQLYDYLQALLSVKTAFKQKGCNEN